MSQQGQSMQTEEFIFFAFNDLCFMFKWPCVVLAEITESFH